MSALVQLGLANVAMATLLALLAAAVGTWGRRPALSHGLWLLVLVKLVTPPLLSVPISWGDEPGPAASEAPAEPPAAPAVSLEIVEVPQPPPTVTVAILVPVTAPTGPMRRPALLPTPPGQGTTLAIDLDDPRRMQVYEARVFTLPAAPAEPDLAIEVPPPPAPPPPEPEVVEPQTESVWLTAMGWIWLAGAVLWLGRTGHHLHAFARLLRHAEPAPADLVQQAERLAIRMGLRRCPPILLVPGRLPPMVWAGLGRPRILFPRDLLDRLDDDQRAALLMHELAHVHRGDHWVRWLELVVGSLYWWLPLTWWTRRQLQAREEECCDAWVVGELPPRAYAGAILQTLDFLATAPPTVPLSAAVLSRVDGLKRRLTLIMEGRTPKQMSSLGWLTMVLTALALLPLLPQPSLPAAPPSPRQPPTIASEAPRPIRVVVARARPLPPEEPDVEASDRLWQLRLRPLTVPEEE